MRSFIEDQQLRLPQHFGQMYTAREGRRKGSDWLVIDGLFVPSETIPAALPIFPVPSHLLIFLSLNLWNGLPSVPFPWVQVALPELHYIKASMLHSWQPALHCPDVITTLLPWNRSLLALWQLSNPPLSSSMFATLENCLFFWLPKQRKFPSDTRVALWNKPLEARPLWVTQPCTPRVISQFPPVARHMLWRESIFHLKEKYSASKALKMGNMTFKCYQNTNPF